MYLFAMVLISVWYIKRNPLRGTRTGTGSESTYLPNISYIKRNPLRGTRTNRHNYLKRRLGFVYKKKSPKGDENLSHILIIDYCITVYKKKSPKGDENLITIPTTPTIV